MKWHFASWSITWKVVYNVPNGAPIQHRCIEWSTKLMLFKRSRQTHMTCNITHCTNKGVKNFYCPVLHFTDGRKKGNSHFSPIYAPSLTPNYTLLQKKCTFIRFSRWRQVTDPNLGSCQICQMVSEVICKRPHSGRKVEFFYNFHPCLT